jgi:rubrerythrin
MSDKLSKLADDLIVHEVMEGSDEELESVMDECGIEPLTALWDHEPPKLPNVPDTSSNRHEWIRIKESDETEMNSSLYLKNNKEMMNGKRWRAFTYECRKCGAKIIVPASENDLNGYGALTCNECLVSYVMEE